MLSIEIKCNGETVVLQPGDRLDLGPLGLLVFYDSEEAEGIRLLAKQSANRVRGAVEFARRDQTKKLLGPSSN
jgi:hypothetical protein